MGFRLCCVGLLCALAVISAGEDCDFVDEEFVDEQFASSLSNTYFLQVHTLAYTWKDLERSAKTSHYRSLTGSTPIEITAKIDKYTAKHPSVQKVIPCTTLDLDAVILLARKLRFYIDASLGAKLPAHDGRQLHLIPWEKSAKQLDSQLYRDALCAETVKLWAHHIRNDEKTHSFGVVLPSLPEYNVTTLSAEALVHNGSFSWLEGHNVVDLVDFKSAGADLTELDWPHWPKKFHWRAKGHGPYPFWQFDPPVSQWKLIMPHATPDLHNPGVDMEIWHSAALKATKFYHSQCKLEWLGFNDVGTRPCVGLQLDSFGPNGTWYLYSADETSKGSDGSFCCASTWVNLNGMNLGAINRRFVDNMKYMGEVDFRGDYYNGRAKRYLMALGMGSLGVCPECGEEPTLPVNVWYETDLEGKPLRFGELGQDLVLDRYLYDRDLPFLPLIYEEMDPASFTKPGMQAFSDEVFSVPAVCRTNLMQCVSSSAQTERQKTRSD